MDSIRPVEVQIRTQVDTGAIRKAVHDLSNAVMVVSIKPGAGTPSSRHEIYGLMAHGLTGLLSALDPSEAVQFRTHLLRIAAEATFAIAAIDGGYLDW